MQSPPALPPDILQLPHGASALTARPTDDHDALQWMELSSMACKGPSEAFWHVMTQYTHELHWNRSIYHIDVVAQVVHPSTDSTAAKHSLPPPEGVRYMVLRELMRKTPAPVGGGVDGCEKSYSVYEWGAHSVSEGCHRAVFGLVVPSTVVTHDNPRGMTFWPFHYPKCAYVPPKP